MEIELLNSIIEKAKTKNDGIWTFKGIKYKVKNNSVTHIIDFKTIYMLQYNFLVKISKTYDYEDQAIKKLKSL